MHTQKCTHTYSLFYSHTHTFTHTHTHICTHAHVRVFSSSFSSTLSLLLPHSFPNTPWYTDARTHTRTHTHTFKVHGPDVIRAPQIYVGKNMSFNMNDIFSFWQFLNDIFFFPKIMQHINPVGFDIHAL